MPDTERMTFTVHLDTGMVFHFQAVDLTISTNRLTGKLAGIEYDGALGEVPRYLDFEHVVAITRAVQDA